MTICSMASNAYHGITGTIKTALTPANASEESKLLRTAAIVKIAVVALAIFSLTSSFYLARVTYSIIPLAFVGIMLHDLWRLSDNMKTFAALGVENVRKYPESEKKDVLLKNMLFKPLLAKFLK